jgi:hypothetical protein
MMPDHHEGPVRDEGLHTDHPSGTGGSHERLLDTDDYRWNSAFVLY